MSINNGIGESEMDKEIGSTGHQIDHLNDHHADDDDTGSGRDSKQSGLPVDRGWAWLILLASFFNIMISNGNYRSFGILFTEIQQRYKSSSSLTALIASCLNASYSICSLLVATVGFKYFSSRQLVATSAVLFSATYALAGQVTSIEMTILLLGLFNGLLRDQSGSYVPGFLLMTSCNLVGGLGLLLLPFMQRLEKRRQKNESVDSIKITTADIRL